MKKIQSLVSFIAAVSILLLIPKIASAQAAASAECYDPNSTPFDSVVQLSNDEYNVFIKLNQTGQTSGAELSVKSLEATGCRVIGAADANATTWVPIGSFESSSSKIPSFFTIILKDKVATQGASAPSILFVAKSNTQCANINDCRVEYKGKNFTLQPQKVSLTADTLKAALYKPFNASTAPKEVVYSIDDKPAYTTSTLEDFNKRYVGPGEHSLITTVILADGQALKSESSLKKDYAPANIILPFIYNQKNVLVLIIIFLVLLTLYYTVLLLARAIRKKSMWKKTHIAHKIPYTTQASVRPVYVEENNYSTIKQFAKVFGIPLVLMVLIFLTSQFIVGVFTVDGKSMETTLHDTAKHPLFRLPVSISNLNSKPYIPKRGEIVVFKKDENNLFDESAAKQESYVVKRVIALPGERVLLKDGDITVFNKEKPAGFNPDKNVPWAGVIAQTLDKYIDITLKDGELFVSGDNRPESIDSRYYGPIVVEQIVGKVFN